MKSMIAPNTRRIVGQTPTAHRARPDSAFRLPLRSPRAHTAPMNALLGCMGSDANERPLVPLYSDALACSICGSDGHEAHSCPFVEQIGCPACLGAGTVLRMIGAASLVETCGVCGGSGVVRRDDEREEAA